MQAALNDIATTPPLPVEVTTQSFTTQGNTLATEAEVPNRRQLTPFATKTTGTPNKETTTTTTGRQSTTAASSSLEPPHNCAVCVDVALKDPLEDCHKASTQNCAQQILGEKAFCLTRQTQNGKGFFTSSI